MVLADVSSAALGPTAEPVQSEANVLPWLRNGDNLKGSNLRLRPAALSCLQDSPDLVSLTLGSSLLEFGESTTVLLTLDSPAPAGGVLIDVQADPSGPCQVPPLVVVPPGLSQWTFAVIANHIEGVTTVVATLNGKNVDAKLTITSNPTVSGHVLLRDYVGDRPTGCTFEFRKPGTSEVVTTFNATLESAGSFKAISPGKGVWDLSLKIGHWLRRTQKVDTLGGSVTQVSFQLINGDVDEDNAVTVFDYSLLSDALDAVPGDARWNPDADLDGDGAVTVFDYAILSSNFDKEGDS